MDKITVIGKDGWEKLYSDTLSFLEDYRTYCRQNQNLAPPHLTPYTLYPTVIGAHVLACALA